MKILLDSSVVIDVLRGAQRGIDLMASLEAEGAMFFLPSPALYELSVGFARQRARIQQALFEGMATHWHEVPFSDRHARAAGEVQADLIAQGEPASDMDAQVAGTALAERFVLASVDDDQRRIAEAAGIGFRSV